MSAKPSFIALMNKSGIACAASDDFTIFQLSKTEPLAVAVNPVSPIPWGDIFNEFQRHGDPTIKDDIEDYVVSILSFLSSSVAAEKWNDLEDSQRQIVVMGYASKDIYPSFCSINVQVNDGHIEADIEAYDEVFFSRISNDGMASSYVTVGGFERLKPILEGATRRVVDQFGEIYKGNDKEKLTEAMLEATNDVEIRNSKGLDTFSMTNLVTSAETLVNANVRLSSLFLGQRPPIECIREMAVITRPEGLKWIKHSLYFE